MEGKLPKWNIEVSLGQSIPVPKMEEEIWTAIEDG